MLKDILRIINRDGLISRTILADELNLTQAVVDDGIDQLLRMGYLLEEKTGENCSTFCTSCPFAKNCSKEIIKTFQISEKGKRYLTR
ncbi:MAG: winged helix-turn-helix domain-containing protein [Bacillota bacterium]